MILRFTDVRLRFFGNWASNPAIKSVMIMLRDFAKVFNTNCHKKSVVALAHKMLRTIYAMLSNGSHYQDKEVDYEALNVQRNAPRWIKMLRKHGFIATPAAA